MGKIILGYWNMRGLVERIRLMLEYMEIEYVNKKYELAQTSDYNGTEWMGVKYSLGFDFPNLPYIIDGERKLTQSWAIMRYLARMKGNMLYPEAGEQEIRCDLATNVVHDFRTKFTEMIYNRDFETLKAKYFESLPTMLKQFEAFLTDQKWLAGGKLTYVDFAFAETLSRHLLLSPKCFDGYEKLKKYYEDFQNLDKIKAYHKSGRFQMYPFHLPFAQWGHGPE